MPQKTDAVIAELMDRRLLNDVDPDLHQEIAKAVVKAVHTASLQGEDAVERVARIIDPDAFSTNYMSRDEDWQPDDDKPKQMRARDKARAILATGLVTGEVAIRADQREIDAKVCDQIRNNAERRAAQHEDGEARNSALDKMEGAIQCAAAIRSGGGQ